MQNIIIVEQDDWKKLMADIKDIKQKLLNDNSQNSQAKKYYNTKEAMKETGISRPQLYIKLAELVEQGAIDDGRLKKNGKKYVIPHNTLHNIILKGVRE